MFETYGDRIRPTATTLRDLEAYERLEFHGETIDWMLAPIEKDGIERRERRPARPVLARLWRVLTGRYRGMAGRAPPVRRAIPETGVPWIPATVRPEILAELRSTRGNGSVRSPRFH
jgi:hypothetical protein